MVRRCATNSVRQESSSINNFTLGRWQWGRCGTNPGTSIPREHTYSLIPSRPYFSNLQTQGFSLLPAAHQHSLKVKINRFQLTSLQKRVGRSRRTHLLPTDLVRPVWTWWCENGIESWKKTALKSGASRQDSWLLGWAATLKWTNEWVQRIPYWGQILLGMWLRVAGIRKWGRLSVEAAFSPGSLWLRRKLNNEHVVLAVEKEHVVWIWV